MDTERLDEIGRLSDFCSILKKIGDSSFDSNIALHLLLDIGQFYRQSTIYSMRYSEESLSFWVTVAKLFKGRGLSFFRGFKGEGLKDDRDIVPDQCKINFDVPSDPIIQKEMKKFLIDVGQPGIIDISLDAFAAAHAGKDVKLSIDGKKVATGFGVQHGDENLCGHEDSPNLAERQARHQDEIQLIRKQIEEVQTLISIGDKSLSDVDATRNDLLTSISNLSNRVRELREYVVKRQRTLDNLMRQVEPEADWKKSKLAGSISFWQTKIIHSRANISDLLDCIDKLGYCVACLNGTNLYYVQGENISLGSQSNYVCLKDLDTDNASELDSSVIKQRSEAWHRLRENSRVSGSTLFNALGLRTLKEQQQHFDKVFSGKKRVESQELQELFKYGTEQEINALGTFIGKVMPVYYPHLFFREDGCETLLLGDGYAVVSGDGSGISSDGNTELAVEFKCPKPGKTHTTDQHYCLPVYYSTQLLSQMYAKNCVSSAYLCFTPVSSTFLCGAYNADLWGKVWMYAEELYGNKDGNRPKKRDTYQSEILKELKIYSSTHVFTAEFPSLKCTPCSCPSTDDVTDVYGHHEGTQNDDQLSLSYLAASLDKSLYTVQEAYQILMKAAKEVLVTVVSDLDRMGSPLDASCNAIPIQYGFSGYSLSMSTARSFILEAINACEEKDLDVKVVAFDGQFAELAVQDESGRPLTVLRLMKKFWEDIQKKERKLKLCYLLSSHDCLRDIVVTRNGSSITLSCNQKHNTVKSPQNIAKAFVSKSNANEVETSNDPLGNIDDGDTLEANLSEDAEECGETMSNELELALVSLLALKEDSKWKSTSLEEFSRCFQGAIKIQNSFNVQELKTLADLKHLAHQGLRKAELVNLVSSVYSDGSRVDIRRKSPKPLKDIVKASVRKWNISAINVAYAQLTFSEAFEEWDQQNAFNGQYTIYTEDGDTITIPKWYAQPMLVNNKLIQPIIDPHHLFVNNRAACCSKGMAGMGILPDAWWKVAKESKTNGTGLSVQIACDLLDRQSNAFAQTTFSEKVEVVMKQNGDFTEANWCRLLRNWYSAIDTAAIPLKSRVESFLAMRSALLDVLNVGHFPPPGAFVKGMTCIQFEGIMTNVDRRLQLYAMVKDGTYNQRAITSLDSETFFSAFQDYDPKGTGVLRTEDVPTALGSAVYIVNQRLKPSRKFHMKTSRKSRVYQVHKLLSTPASTEVGNCPSQNESHINLRSHFFDLPDRKTSRPKRKSGCITPFGQPSKGATGVRAYHKCNEEKILPHRRYGLCDDEVAEGLRKKAKMT